VSSSQNKLLPGFLFLLTFLHTHTANIIWDLDGVLTTPSTKDYLYFIQPWKFIGGFNPFGIEDFVYDFLDMVEHRTADTPLTVYRTRLLPKIMCDWLAGHISAAEVRAKVAAKLHACTRSIDSKQKLKLVKSITDFMFTPEHLASVMQPIKDSVRLFKKCLKKVNEKGEPLNKVFILSNWDTESFAHLVKHPELCQLFQSAHGTIISGDVGMLKPDPNLFIYAFKEWGINPTKDLTFFIDDTLVNIMAAQRLNMRYLIPLHCKKEKIGDIEKRLAQYGVI
jgi:FMN phosphatase YigB (HAD superfamily)